MTAPVEPKTRKRASNPNRGSKPGEKRGGRKAGTPNRVTVEFRETVRKLLEDNAPNVQKWLQAVAAENPDKALQRLAQLAEYAAPKLVRTEVVGDPNAPLRVEAETLLRMDPHAATEAYRAALGK